MTLCKPASLGVQAEVRALEARLRRGLDPAPKPYRRRWQQLHERLEWYHWETRERRFMRLMFDGKARMP